MESVRFKAIIERAEKSEKPCLEFIRRATTSGKRLGVFAASFNPVTTAHLELMRHASSQFSLDEILALAGTTNADKRSYACSLEDRIEMLLLTFDNDSRVSIGISSHAYFVDMIEAIKPLYPPETEPYFILGFDTFERLLDRADQYTTKYHCTFTGRREALDFLFEHSRLIVAGREGSGRQSIDAVIESEIPQHADRVFFLDTPEDLGERSATEVRDCVQAGLSISGLVPTAVERYVIDRGIYRAGDAE
jgi:nicotinate (nicotinamide) nucleotide adenylyltransferase